MSLITIAIETAVVRSNFGSVEKMHALVMICTIPNPPFGTVDNETFYHFQILMKVSKEFVADKYFLLKIITSLHFDYLKITNVLQ